MKKPSDRCEKILTLLKTTNMASIKTLAEMLDGSTMTVQRFFYGVLVEVVRIFRTLPMSAKIAQSRKALVFP
jgi:hypothetical protein